MQIVFKKVIFGDRFCSDFADLQTNNMIEFNGNNVCVIYGPNGTGKTSLTSVLRMNSEDVECSVEIDGIAHTRETPNTFHIVEDQNGRNIIAGSTEDFILGDNIKREYELKRKLDHGFEQLFKTVLVNELKNNFGITRKNTPFDGLIINTKIRFFISDIANNRSKGKQIIWDDYTNTITSLSEEQIIDEEYPFFYYFINDFKSDDSIIRRLLEISIESIRREKEYSKIEETSEALRILEKYKDLHECIVCDSEIDPIALIQRKTSQKEYAISTLSEESKSIIDNILSQIGNEDPFEIKKNLEIALNAGSNENLISIFTQLERYKTIFNSKICNMLIRTLSESGLTPILAEYSGIVQESPEFESEDIIFIETFLNDCLERKIRLERDGDKNLHLLLGNEEFLNHPRKELALSNGEQNFLSLSFELLKARKIDSKIIILDDPISSFDSIYKNKIAYAILKILDNKKSIILTHNTDLIKLLEHQVQKCFNLYQLHNRSDGENGFVSISRDEVKILLYIHELINLLRGDIKSEILNEGNFLISIVPFMRGYCQILGDTETRNILTKLMHGYEEVKINLSNIYARIFSSDIIISTHEVSVSDILGLNIDNPIILDDTRYPLLNRTLKHTLTYLYLRLAVERKLTTKYSIDTSKHEMLSQIILASFRTQSKKDIENRVFFLSRKTLLNEFNHFEMDMNIFQPAIDIQNQVLDKERKDIISKLALI